jgi:hypothetical protein
MSRLKVDQLIRLALDRGATLDEARTAAFLAVKMIDAEGLLDQELEPEYAPAPRYDPGDRAPAGAPQLGAGRLLPAPPTGALAPAGQPRMHVLNWNVVDDQGPPARGDDFVFPVARGARR